MRHLLILICLCFVVMPRAHAEQILIAADRWCPFNCEPGPELPGFMVEVAQRVFAKQGYDVKYIEMNWSRAIQEARKGNVNAIDAPSHHLLWQPTVDAEGKAPSMSYMSEGGQ